ncbi:hypothetical protein AZH43_13995 [Acinetobacter pragensis]|uniref:Uncharacterized protein n=1 Tax=Acinetobacter pragensis TaxID=1806892 RepID=A0A151Y0N0_9GAMM|nr:hypothetical protein AZH43_13995 [Acinetobacter pragensis]
MILGATDCPAPHPLKSSVVSIEGFQTRQRCGDQFYHKALARIFFFSLLRRPKIKIPIQEQIQTIASITTGSNGSCAKQKMKDRRGFISSAMPDIGLRDLQIVIALPGHARIWI